MPRADKNYPEGLDFLIQIDHTADSCCEISDCNITTSGTINHGLVMGIGTVISLLDRLGCCWWGCRGGDHIIEYLVIRACSSSHAAVRLLRSAFYDEALSLARNVGEIGNLLYLFAHEPDTFMRWRLSSRKERLDNFGPIKVRMALENLKVPLPIDKNTYAELSERATHVTPEIRPQAHKDSIKPKTGGLAFDEYGATLCLQQIALAIATVAGGASGIVPLDNNMNVRISKVAAELIRKVAESLTT